MRRRVEQFYGSLPPKRAFIGFHVRRRDRVEMVKVISLFFLVVVVVVEEHRKYILN